MGERGDQMYIQKYYLYLNLTKPSEGLFLSYIGMDAQGAAIRPSYLIGMMKNSMNFSIPINSSTSRDMFLWIMHMYRKSL